MEAFQRLSQEELTSWIESQQDTDTQLKIFTEQALRTSHNTDAKGACLLLIGKSLDNVAPLDKLLEFCNALLADGGTLHCSVTPSAVKMEQLRQQWPWPLRRPAAWAHYLWHRMGSKLWISRGLYRLMTREHHRSMSRVEILGRLRHAGFETQTQRFCNSTLILCASRIGAPIAEAPHLGSIIALPRIGKDGKVVHIYKMRTMHAYSEFLQEKLYTHHHLAKTGKISHDYRVTFVGRWLRRNWIDEWPMIYNLLRGDIKLVGVRPLSNVFFKKYSTEMQQLRIQYKPGLLPPLYADHIDADHIDAVQANERAYLEAYAQHPLRTDWRYFWRILYNVVFHRRRSA